MWWNKEKNAPIAFVLFPFFTCFLTGWIMSTHYKPSSLKKMSTFCVGQTIRLFPYDLVTEELKASESYEITKREGNNVTLTMTVKTNERNTTRKCGKDYCVKTVTTRIGTIKNPPSEVISPEGYCPCYAYDYDMLTDD